MGNDSAMIYKIIGSLPKDIVNIYFAERRANNYEVPLTGSESKGNSSLIDGLNAETENNIRQRWEEYKEREGQREVDMTGAAYIEAS